jgi:hypothetical protein
MARPRYKMEIVTSEGWLDGLLTKIVNNAPEAQQPIRGSGSWNIKSSGIGDKEFTLDSIWGGRLMQIKWRVPNGQSVQMYVNSNTGLEVAVDIELGRDYWRANRLYESILESAQGRAYRMYPLEPYQNGK